VRGPMRRARLALVGVAALALAFLVAVPAATGVAGAASGQLALAGLLEAPLATLGATAVPPPGTRGLGPLAPSHVMQLGIALAPRDAASLEAYATSVNTPGSPSFGHFISPAQFRAAFGPTPSAIAAVQEVLRAEGFSVSSPSENGLIMPVTAPVSVVERALHLDMRAYGLSDGTTGWAATTAPKLQVPIAGDVTAILGLDELVGPHSLLQEGPRPAAVPLARGKAGAEMTQAPRTVAANGGPLACSAAAAGASSGNGWTFDELAKAYGIDRLYDNGALGEGETVAIFELEPFSASDVRTFDTCYFGASAAAAMQGRLHVVRVDGGISPGSGSGEAILDVEDVSALAPHAAIEVYEAPSASIGTEYATNDIYNAMVNADSANVISTSWGLCEPALQVAAPGAQEVENELFEEAAAQGQSVFAAAGDAGSNDCAYGSTPTSPAVSVDDPASQPFVVGVGGTSLRSDSQPPVERVWNDGSFGGGAGGGISDTWTSPGWQADSGVEGVSNSYSQSAAYDFCRAEATKASAHRAAAAPPCRDVPDVAIDADEDSGTSVFQASEGGWSTIGGTSTAAPMWAAITTDIASSNSCSGLALNARNHERDLGFVAPALYEAAADSPGGDFNDITSGSNDIFGLGKGYPATAGYDLASGLGSPIVTSPRAPAEPEAIGTDSALSAALCSLLTPSRARPAVTALSPGHGAVSGGNTVIVKGSGFTGSGVSVKAVNFGPRRTTSFALRGDDSLAVTVPAAAPVAGSGGEARGTPGPVDVTVTLETAAGLVTTAPVITASRYIYTAGSTTSPKPSVSGLGPSAGPVRGGNVVDVYGSSFGSGSPLSSVSFGGVRARKWTYLANYELQVTVPAETKATRCMTGRGFDPANTCQVEVIVTGRHGASEPARILPPYFGNMSPNNEGIVVPRAGTEIDPAASEYDYAPVPRITSVGPQPYSESGPEPIRITGSGFNVLTLEWINVGQPFDANNNYSAFDNVTATEVTLGAALPSADSKARYLQGGISARSLGGLSRAVAFLYRQ